MGLSTWDWDRIARAAALPLSETQVWRLFHHAVADLNVALCLHHVSRRQRDVLTMPEADLDRFIEHATAVPRRERWLTITFDDGYDDACHYVETRAPRFPNVEFLLFVCPTKLERRVGFRWDLPVVDDTTPRDLRQENERADLRAAAHLHDCQLASVERCRGLRRLENADVGNHTNCHFRARCLDTADIEQELSSSSADFQRLFGPQRHFAFPFGKPEEDFGAREIGILRALGPHIVWTTARRPYPAAHRRPGAVLPRFPVDGRATADQLGFWIALLSLRAQARGLEPFYASTPPAEASGERLLDDVVGGDCSVTPSRSPRTTLSMPRRT